MLKKRPNSTPCLFKEHINWELTVNYNTETAEASNLTRTRVLHLLEEEMEYLSNVTIDRVAELILEGIDTGKISIEEVPIITN